MFCVYVIQSLLNKKYYIGFTNNLQRRLYEHNHNNTASLKNKGPYKLIYQEAYSTKQEAQRRERIIKSYKGGNAFKKMLEGFKR